MNQVPDAVQLVRAAIGEHYRRRGVLPSGVVVVERAARGVVDLGDGILRVDRATMDEVARLAGSPMEVVEAITQVPVGWLLGVHVHLNNIITKGES